MRISEACCTRDVQTASCQIAAITRYPSWSRHSIEPPVRVIPAQCPCRGGMAPAGEKVAHSGGGAEWASGRRELSRPARAAAQARARMGSSSEHLQRLDREKSTSPGERPRETATTALTWRKPARRGVLPVPTRTRSRGRLSVTVRWPELVGLLSEPSAGPSVGAPGPSSAALR